MQNNTRIDFLLKKYLDGDIDLSLQDELFELIENESINDQILQVIAADLQTEEPDSVSLPPYVAEDIIRKILESEHSVNQLIATKPNRFSIFKQMAIAAAFIGLICLSYFTINYVNNSRTSFARIIPQNIEYVENNTNQVQLLLLSDSSKVYLNPGSILHFAKQFAGENREVYLEGEAFFKVKKNPHRPFLVYYNNIVTKVLGTSFRVGTNKQNGQLVVEVKTGRVQVFENAKLALSDKTITPVIITPNQKVTYDKSIRRFETAIVSHPEPVVPNEELSTIEPHALFFEQQKLNVVLGQVEKYYQIEITVENSAIYNCVFTGDISNLDLFSALKIISIATNAEYEVNGTKILIKGKGCN